MLVLEVVLYLGGCCEVRGLIAFFGDALGDRRRLGLFGDFLCVCHHGYFLGAFCPLKANRGSCGRETADIGIFVPHRLYRSDLLTPLSSIGLYS